MFYFQVFFISTILYFEQEWFRQESSFKACTEIECVTELEKITIQNFDGYKDL